MPALVVRDGPSAGQRVDVAGETELGRVNTQPLREDTEASRRHAVVRAAASGLEIEDLGSSNGTWVNDERISGTRQLRPGDRVRIGQTTFEVEAEPDTGAAIAPTPGPSETRVAPAPDEQPGRPVEPAQPAAPAEPAQPGQPVAPAQPVQPTPPTEAARPQPAQPQPAQPAPPFQPDQAATAPQAPVGGGFGPQQGFGQQPAGQQAGAYGQPAAGYDRPGGYGAAPGRRPGAVTAAAILLLVGGVLALLWAAYDFVVSLGGLDTAGQVEAAFDLPGLRTTVLIIIGLNAVAAIGGLLEIIGGVRVFSLKGRSLGIIGATLVVLAWLAIVILILARGFEVLPLAMTAYVLSGGVSLAALITLLTAGRHFSAPRY